MSQVISRSTSIGRSSGSIQISITPLITMSVKLYVSCSDTASTYLHNACPECHGPALQPRTCEVHGPLHAVVQVYRDGDEVFEITEQDAEELKLPTLKNFILTAIVLKSDILSLLSQSSKQYFLNPDGHQSTIKYAALLKTLIKSKQCIIGKYSLRSGRESLAAIMPDNNSNNNGLILLQLPFNDVRRSAPKLILPNIASNVITDMKTILETLPPFDYTTTIDSYDAALQKLILVKTAAKFATESSSKTKTNGKPSKKLPQIIDKITELNNAVAALKLNAESKPDAAADKPKPRQRKKLLRELAESK